MTVVRLIPITMTERKYRADPVRFVRMCRGMQYCAEIEARNQRRKFSVSDRKASLATELRMSGLTEHADILDPPFSGRREP